MRGITLSVAALLLPALLATCAPSAESSGASVPRLVRRIPLSTDGGATPRGRIDHLAFDPATRRLFVACVEAGALAVVEIEGAAPVRLLAGLHEPQGVVVVPAGNGHQARVFVACGGDGKVHVFDATSLRELGAVFAGEDADNVRFDSQQRRLHVGCGSEQGGAIVAIDPDALTVLGRTQLSAHAEGFQLEPGSPRMFTNVPGAKEAEGHGSVLVADRERAAVTATWPLAAGRNFPLAFLPNHTVVLTGCRQPPVLLALDASDGRELSRAPCTADCDDVFFDPATSTVLAIGGGEGQGGGLDVFAWSGGGLRPLATLPLPPRARTGLFVPERRALYVAVPALTEGATAAILEFIVD